MKSFSRNFHIYITYLFIFLNIADYSKQVKQRVSERFLFIHNLEEEITYTFSVRAQTIDYGPPVIGNVTTGPQEGSPRPIRNLVLSKEKNAILLSWTNSNSGRGPILGYYIESRRKGKQFSFYFLQLLFFSLLQITIIHGQKDIFRKHNCKETILIEIQFSLTKMIRISAFLVMVLVYL